MVIIVVVIILIRDNVCLKDVEISDRSVILSCAWLAIKAFKELTPDAVQVMPMFRPIKRDCFGELQGTDTALGSFVVASFVVQSKFLHGFDS